MVARLGCRVCQRMYPNAYLMDTPVELHHVRGGQGWGKGDFTTLIPLCVEHHRGNTGVHGLGVKGFVKQYGYDEWDLLKDTMVALEKLKIR